MKKTVFVGVRLDAETAERLRAAVKPPTVGYRPYSTQRLHEQRCQKGVERVPEVCIPSKRLTKRLAFSRFGEAEKNGRAGRVAPINPARCATRWSG